MQSPRQYDAPVGFTLKTLLSVVIGVPACTACGLFFSGAFVTILMNGGSFNLSGMAFWSGVAFFVGSLGVVTLALRAWVRVRRGAPSFLPLGVTRLVPAFIGLGVLAALGLGGYGWSHYLSQVEQGASRFCWTWPHKSEVSAPDCDAAARVCFKSRPIDEDFSSSKYRNAMETCMMEWLQTRHQS
ncbi:hypothetical protein [Myxococcus hansupus]|uniref:hypothetical protein n=1 Tax=Pseudomyxococcus hansupus TaxID=1297742 RepID=UPI0005D130F0|nr:hypothetical protein [Myxococcus hansupus]